jgi:hypothetical protein
VLILAKSNAAVAAISRAARERSKAQPQFIARILSGCLVGATVTAGRFVRQQSVAVTTPVQTTRPMVTEDPRRLALTRLFGLSTMPDISSLKRRATKMSTATEKPVQNGPWKFTGKATSPN